VAILTPAQLYDAVERSDRRITPLVERRREALREYAGRFYYEDDGEQRPLNLVTRAIDVLVAYLAAKTGEYEATSRRPALRGEAMLLGMAMTRLAHEINWVETSRLCLLDGLLGPKGIVRLGIRVTDEIVTLQGREYNRGQPYARRVSLEDWIFDPAARCREEAAFEGDRYRVPREALLESGLFRNDVVERIPAYESAEHREHDAAPEMSSNIGFHQRYELAESVELMDVFYHEQGRVIKATLPADRVSADDYLRINVWNGPERGAYEWMEFFPIPDQPHGLPFIAKIREQSDLANAILRKVAQQAEETKRLLVYQLAQGTEDVNVILDAPNGAAVGIHGDPHDAQVYEFGGVSPDLVAMGNMVMAWNNMQAGNPDLLQGLSRSRSGTATEYQGQRENAQSIIEDMAFVHDRFQDRVAEHLAWHLLTDPFIRMPIPYRLPGAEQIELAFDPLRMEGDHQQFSYRLQPMSMRGLPPEVKAARMLDLIGLGMHALELEMASGGAWSTEATLRLAGRALGLEEELDQLVRSPELAMRTAFREQHLPAQASIGRPLRHVSGEGRGEGRGRGLRPTTAAGVRQSARTIGQNTGRPPAA